MKCEPYCEFSNKFMSELVLFNPHHCKFSSADRGVDARRKLVRLMLSGRHLTGAAPSVGATHDGEGGTYFVAEERHTDEREAAGRGAAHWSVRTVVRLV